MNTTTISDRKLFIQELAFYLHINGKESISYVELVNFACSYFNKPPNSSELDSIILDLQTTGVFTSLGDRLYFSVADFRDYFIYMAYLDYNFLNTALVYATKNELVPLPNRKQLTYMLGKFECANKVNINLKSLEEIAVSKGIKLNNYAKITIPHEGILFGNYDKFDPWAYINSKNESAIIFRYIFNEVWQEQNDGTDVIYLRIASPLGLHARASSRVVAYFSKLESAKNKDVHFVRNGQKADPRSIMSLMLLAVPTGQVVEIRFKGYSRAKIEDVMIDIGMTPETELPDRWMWNESKPQL